MPRPTSGRLEIASIGSLFHQMLGIDLALLRHDHTVPAFPQVIMEGADPPSPSYLSGVSPLSATRARPPLPNGPRIPNNKPLQGQLTLTNLPPSSTTSSPSTSTSRLASPAPSLALSTAFPPDPFPPSYAESPYELGDPPVRILPPPTDPALDVGVKAAPTISRSSTAAKLTVKTIPKTVALVPPPKINFDSVPIPFKGLPLEAAQWTFSSSELQEVVSRAIRMSAQESFIRVVSADTLDNGVVKENERLATLKLMTQSQYRFQVHRRTMLLQALNSSASAVPHDPSTVSNLAGQLSETTSQCDRLLEELLRISDQQTQLSKLQDLHWASALAIALRKINKSYERKTNELRGARDKIEMLEAELEEAWKEAENVAQEIDNLQASMSDEEIDDSEEVTMHTAHVVGVTGLAIASTAKLMSGTESSPPVAIAFPTQTPEPRPPSRSNSVVSRRNSERSSRWMRVAAAKTRSRRTSNASLRVTKRSVSRAGRSSEDKLQPPPVPNIPGNFHETSFLDLDSRHTSMSRDGDGVASLLARDKPQDRHPFATDSDEEAIPSAWLLGDTSPKAHTDDRDRVQSMRPFPLIRRDSAGRSSSEYNKGRPQHARYSVPLLSSSPSDHGAGPPPRSETP